MATQAGPDVYENLSGYEDTWDIGGGRFPLYADSAFDPQAYTGTTSPVPLALLSIPPTYGEFNAMGEAGTYSAQGMANQNAAAAPFSFVHSPTPYIILGLIVGFFALHKLYFSKKK
jgi:hypothetical protein